MQKIILGKDFHHFLTGHWTKVTFKSWICLYVFIHIVLSSLFWVFS